MMNIIMSGVINFHPPSQFVSPVLSVYLTKHTLSLLGGTIVVVVITE